MNRAVPPLLNPWWRRGYYERLRSGQLVAKLSAPLVASPLKGPWQDITDEVAWHLHNSHFKTAAKYM